MTAPRRSARLATPRRSSRIAASAAKQEEERTRLEEKAANRTTAAKHTPSKAQRAPRKQHSAKSGATIGSKRAPEPEESARPSKRRKTNAQSKTVEEASEDASFSQEPDPAVQPTDSPQSQDVDTNFLEALICVILKSRILRQQLAERRKINTEQAQLRRLLDFTRPQLHNVPVTDGYQQVQDGLKADVARYEKYLEQRNEHETLLNWQIENLTAVIEARKARLDDFADESLELAMPSCLRDSVEFQGALRRYRSTSGIMKKIELELERIHLEWSAASDKSDSHVKTIAQLAQGAGSERVERDEAQGQGEVIDAGSPSKEDSKRIHELLYRQKELQKDQISTGKSSSWHKEILARFAERALVVAGVLPPSELTAEGFQLGSEPKDQQEANEPHQAPAEHPPPEQTPAFTRESETLRKKSITAELEAAMDHLSKSRSEYDNCRKLTVEEMASLPHPVSALEVAWASIKKLSQKTRQLIEAEERCRIAKQAARDAGIIDRFPREQTCNFEDRPDDGYAESMWAQKRDHIESNVEEWMSVCRAAGNRTPPTSVHEKSATLPDFGALYLGEDYIDGLPHGNERKRIDDYQQACKDLRESGQFPKAASDPLNIADQEA